MIRPEFKNSAIVSAPEWLIMKNGTRTMRHLPVRYGVFEHPAAGKCLIDTGYSRRIMSGRRGGFLRLYGGILKPKLTSDVLPDAMPDVDTIIVTHLHADHISALRDYPSARIMLDGHALDHYLVAGWFQRIRHGFFKELLPDDFADRLVRFQDCPTVEAPMGLGEAFDLFGDGSVLGVPLPGHMLGHTGVMFTGDRPLLYAADSEWLWQAIDERRTPGFPATQILEDKAAAQATREKLRAFVAAGGGLKLCHDPEGEG